MSTVDDVILVDPAVQPRFNLNEEAVNHYAELMKQGVKFPPIDVFKVPEVGLVLAAGFHRYKAAGIAGIELDVTVHEGSMRDAKAFAIASNIAHGVHYSNADKRRIVETYLSDPEWRELSDREIARRCGVSNTFVSLRREERGDREPHDPDDKAPEFDDDPTEDPEQSDSPEPATTPKSDPPAAPAPAEMVDKEMQVVPTKLRDVFGAGAEFFREAIDNLRQTRDTLADAAKSGRFGKFLREQDVNVNLNNLIEALKFAQPHAVCPKCRGDGCDDCRQQGWMPSTLFKAATK